MSEATASSDMFSIQLYEPVEGEGYHVRSVDIKQPYYRHRLSFVSRNALRDVLAPGLCAYVESALEKISQAKSVFTEPSAVVELPGLILGKLRMLVHRNKKGMKAVIIRFAYFVGGVQSAFRLDTHFSLPTSHHREAVAVSALMDICVPTFDLLSSSDRMLSKHEVDADRLQDRLTRISQIQSDLSFYMDLLKRYIQSLDQQPKIAVVSASDHGDLPRKIRHN